MRLIRTALWLSIVVFISTLFWPMLLDKQLLLLSLIFASALLLIPQSRILAVIPIVAIYFTLYTNLTLTGQFYPSSTRVNHSSLQAVVDGQDHNIVVQINSLISDSNKSYFKANLIELDGDHLNYSPIVEMRWYKANVSLQAGQLHRFIVRFKPVYGRANPAGFDRQKWSYSEHVAYQVTIKKYLESINKEITLRAGFYQKVKNITQDLVHQGLLLALSFADKSLISYQVKERIRNLGISHLFAISGLHIGLLFSFVYLFSQTIFNHLLPVSKMGWFSLRLINFSALLGAWFYAYLAGFSLPTQRAFLMLFIAVFIFSMKRKCAKSDLLLLVLFVVLIWDPLAILSLSLWLSFSAVAIIMLLFWSFPVASSPPNKIAKIPMINKVKKYLTLLLFLQLGLTLLMLPVQLISFSGLSFVAIFINLIAVPFFSLLIIPMVLIAAIFTLFCPALALLLFSFCDQLLSLFFQFTSFATHSYQFYSLADERLLLFLFTLFIFVFIAHFKSVQTRKMSYLLSVVVLCLWLVNQFQKSEDKAIWFVDVIDVGQGLSVLIRSEGKTLLYDTGARYASGFNMVDSEVAPYLTSLGIKQLDHLVISHSDNDHAGGADIISSHMHVKARYSGEPLKSKHQFTPCKVGHTWPLGGLNVEILSPDIIGKNNNNNSCVLRISDGNSSVLLTGDIEKRQEKILVVELGNKLNSDILFAPHHGSRHSSTAGFIKAVSPQWVVFSAGFMNHWGFPAKEVVQRYQKQSVKMVNSGLSGLIRFQITPQAINMKTFREDLAPYWYHHSFFP
ncbi:DNA internalization-related competence protein ComEC/Rec2 [Psychromonas hadalis]|uniref:DNA internalization-related competence protein ComEC/Rec2 n=1 Tax=Psychromonas hadalis TaxID=211669 RepID=UPI0003B37F8B|nr:DNA internalization-related competence protein ComEC/Rec2 [Psychromonas hadalis]